jgi:hypothetical protein
MGQLRYNVYSNITDRKYLSIEKKMMIWEYRMSVILLSLGWMKIKSVTENDALIVDFVKRNDFFYGNMGIVYEDRPDKISFNFYVTKSFDVDDYRYFLADDIFKEKEMDFFENNINGFTRLALEKYNSWNKMQVMSLGEKVILG